MFHKYYFNLTYCNLYFFLIVFSLIFPCFGHGNYSSIPNAVEKLPPFLIPDWSLTFIGRSISSLLRNFLTLSTSESTKSIIQTGLNNGRKFLATAIGYTVILQVPVGVFTLLGILICIFLIFLPCFIFTYRSRYSSSFTEPSSHCINSSSKLLVVFEIFAVCVFMITFGAVVLSLASLHLEETLLEVFRFANYSVDLSYMMAKMIQINYFYRLNDISQSATHSLHHLYEINEKVGETYLTDMFDNMRPVRQLARAIDWNIHQVKELLILQSTQLSELANKSVEDVEKYIQNYTSALNDLKKTYEAQLGNQSAEFLDPLSKVHPFNNTINISSVFDTSISVVTSASKINFESSVRKMYFDLQKMVVQTFYDPQQLIHLLSIEIYHTEQKVSVVVEDFIKFVGKYITEDNRKILKQLIDYICRDSRTVVSAIDSLMFLLACISFGLALVMLLTYLIALIGSKGFCMDEDDYDLNGIYLQSGIAYYGGRVLCFLCYVAACVMWLYWVWSVCLFLLSTIPTMLCESTKDLDILDITIDHPNIRDECRWFYLFSSSKFNTTMRKNIENCRKDSSYFVNIPDSIVDISKLEKIKTEVNFTNAESSFKNNLQNISGFNISNSEHFLRNLSTVVAGIDTHSFFVALKKYAWKIRRTKASVILLSILEDFKNQGTIATKAELTLKAYDLLMRNISLTLVNEDSFNLAKQRMNVTLQSTLKQMDYLLWASEGFLKSVLNDSGTLYGNILRHHVYSAVDKLALDMKDAVREFRKSISFCNGLAVLEEKSEAIFCCNLLCPVAICWFGFVLISVFQLFSLIFAFPAIRVFEMKVSCDLGGPNLFLTQKPQKRLTRDNFEDHSVISSSPTLSDKVVLEQTLTSKSQKSRTLDDLDTDSVRVSSSNLSLQETDQKSVDD